MIVGVHKVKIHYISEELTFSPPQVRLQTDSRPDLPSYEIIPATCTCVTFHNISHLHKLAGRQIAVLSHNFTEFCSYFRL